MKILDNPVYVGKIAYGRNVTEKVKGSRDEYKRVKADDYMVVDGMHEAVVDPETWEATRLRRKETGVKWEKTHSLDHEHILSGLVKCPICGAGLVGTLRRRKIKNPARTKMISITSACTERRLMKRISVISGWYSARTRSIIRWKKSFWIW